MIPLRRLFSRLFTYDRQREAQRAFRAMEDRRRQSLRDLTDADLLAYARMWGGEVCWPELKRRGLAVPDLEPRGYQPKP
jgi:hypothetical protein